MLRSYPVTLENRNRLADAYAVFRSVALTDYAWPMAAIEFTQLTKLMDMGLMRAQMLENADTGEIVGFILYNPEAFGSLEIKVVYISRECALKSAMDTLFGGFLQTVRDVPGWQVISYPMMGPRQLEYADLITWYGFKPVGQAVVRFHLDDALTVELFSKLQLPPLPSGYRLAAWDPRYQAGALDVLAEAFAKSVDALWDPRFRSRQGIEEALRFVQSGMYGVFWPECTTLLLNADDQPVGVCLMNMVSPEEVNIPLIGLAESERKQRVGRTLLAYAVSRCMQAILESKLPLKLVSATVATENLPAIKMYRFVGFQEAYWYPHVYQEREDVLTRKPGQWC